MASEYSVLIIDDDIWIQRILSKTLQSFGFGPVHIASNGFSGVAKAIETKPTLIMTDILMPELSGHQVLRLLKTIKSTKEIPVLMVSAMSDATNIGFAVKGGISGFISKPFSSATIFDKLVAIFGREELDQISKGANNSGGEGMYEEKKNKSDDYLPAFNFDIENLNPTLIMEDLVPPEHTKVNNFSKHYNEDERKSIDSIKKLLSKQK